MPALVAQVADHWAAVAAQLAVALAHSPSVQQCLVQQCLAVPQVVAVPQHSVAHPTLANQTQAADFRSKAPRLVRQLAPMQP